MLFLLLIMLLVRLYNCILIVINILWLSYLLLIITLIWFLCFPIILFVLLAHSSSHHLLYYLPYYSNIPPLHFPLFTFLFFCYPTTHYRYIIVRLRTLWWLCITYIILITIIIMIIRYLIIVKMGWRCNAGKKKKEASEGGEATAEGQRRWGWMRWGQNPQIFGFLKSGIMGHFWKLNNFVNLNF